MNLYFPFQNNQLPDEYGSNVPEHVNKDRINQYSFPFEVHDIPESTRFLAWDVIDWDTIPLIGFPWIHWSVTNVSANAAQWKIPAGFSLHSTAIQGENSLNSIVHKVTNPLWRFNRNHRHYETHYSGPRPRSGTHSYRITVYALNNPLPLTNGYSMSEFMNTVDESLISVVSSNLAYTKNSLR